MAVYVDYLGETNRMCLEKISNVGCAILIVIQEHLMMSGFGQFIAKTISIVLRARALSTKIFLVMTRINSHM